MMIALCVCCGRENRNCRNELSEVGRAEEIFKVHTATDCKERRKVLSIWTDFCRLTCESIKVPESTFTSQSFCVGKEKLSPEKQVNMVSLGVWKE